MQSLNTVIFTLVFLLSNNISFAFDYPFTLPLKYSSKYLYDGDEGSKNGELTSPERNFKITYSIGGAYAPFTKNRSLKDNDSLDSLFYYNETTVNEVEVRIEGYRVQDAKDTYRFMMWVPKHLMHFSVYYTGNKQRSIVLRDLLSMRFDKTSREQDAAPNH